MESFDNRVREFWEHRAAFLERAGSNDLVAKQLEIAAIARHVRDGMQVLEVGCGNGITAIELVRRFDIDLTGLDYAAEMIRAARGFLQEGESGLRGQVRFEVGDVRDFPAMEGRFDLAYTERVLINLPDWPAQRDAIATIISQLAPGGRYLMCENSQNGLERINEMRRMLELEPISPPWHNRYLVDEEVAGLAIPGVRLVEVECYSSTYYFLSRVVNARLAANQGEQPSYDAPVNQLALRLPSIGDFGQGKLWVWEKSADQGRDEGGDAHA